MMPKTSSVAVSDGDHLFYLQHPHDSFTSQSSADDVITANHNRVQQSGCTSKDSIGKVIFNNNL